MNQYLEPILIFVSLFIGYFLGCLNGAKKTVKEFSDETGQVIRIEATKLKDRFKPAIPTGQIKHQRPEEVYKQKLDPKRREGLEAMKETLDNIPDLVAAKELFRAAKTEEYG